MNSSHVKYVLVGGGAAGSAAAEAIRKYDKAGSILLINQEHSRPYVRPTLSKEFLRREKSRGDISIDPVGWYSEHHIDMQTSRRVTHLDTARHAVALDSGEEIAFDKLLLATGASPKPLRIPGSDLPNVFYLRTIDDCDRLHHAIDKAKAEGRPHPSELPATKLRGRVAIIGAGLLAVELAASLRQINLHVDLILERPYPWAKFAGENVGRFIAKFLEKSGVSVHPAVAAERLEGDGRVQRVVLANGQQIDCDFTIIAMGIVPNREILRGTPIAAEKAILVDDHCRTTVEGIYAAGDCAALLDPLFGKHRLMDHWDSARTLGGIAGANMAGADVAYRGVNSYWSKFFDLTLTAWGDSRFVDRRLVRGIPNPDAPDFAEVGVAADGRICQVLAVGRSSEHTTFQELVGRRFNVEGYQDLINDPSQDLTQLVK